MRTKHKCFRVFYFVSPNTFCRLMHLLLERHQAFPSLFSFCKHARKKLIRTKDKCFKVFFLFRVTQHFLPPYAFVITASSSVFPSFLSFCKSARKKLMRTKHKCFRVFYFVSPNTFLPPHAFVIRASSSVSLPFFIL